jgi:ribose transport system ATP-binding protein
MPQYLLKCEDVHKSFGITKALDGVDFCVERGKIHGLIGENGSGKSTLANIIGRIYAADKGKFTLRGETWTPKSPQKAFSDGVSIIVQETGTVPSITVAENLFLGRYEEFSDGFIVNAGKMEKAADQVLSSIGVTSIYGSQMTARLNMQQRKIVEIAKAVSNDPDLLIADETSNILSEEGREILFRLFDKQIKNNKSVVMITHNIEEAMELCDTLTILRDGKVTATLNKEEFDENRIKSLMIGREIKDSFYRTDNDEYGEEVVLRMVDATSLRDVTRVSLELHKGEILGIGGLAESGMHTLGKMLFGAERLACGKVECNGKTVDSPETAVALGIAYISKDRDVESLAASTNVNANIAITGTDVNVISKFIYSVKKEKKYVLDQIERLKIKVNSRFDKVSSLSGGNKQKVAFAKWFARDCQIYIMDCPTRGIDIGVKQEVYRMMYQLKQQGKSIILIGEEMAELIGMSDRIIILKDGRINREFRRSEGVTEDKLIHSMF